MDTNIDSYVISDGVTSFYAPPEQVDAWKALGYSVYRQELVPVHEGASVSSEPIIATGSTGVAPEPTKVDERGQA